MHGGCACSKSAPFPPLPSAEVGTARTLTAVTHNNQLTNNHHTNPHDLLLLLLLRIPLIIMTS